MQPHCLTSLIWLIGQPVLYCPLESWNASQWWTHRVTAMCSTQPRWALSPAPRAERVYASHGKVDE